MDALGVTRDPADALLALPVTMRDQLLGGWVFCTQPWANTAGPSGVGGQALTACGSCEGCRLAAELRGLVPLDDRPTTCATPIPD